MKRIFILGLFMLVLNQICVFAENQFDYSLMDAPLPNIICEPEYELSENLEFENAISLFSDESYESMIYNLLDSVLAPDNIINHTASLQSNGYYYVDIKVPISYVRDDSLGSVSYQFDLIVSELNEILSKYISYNPEYFYLLPNGYGWSGSYNYNYLNITFKVLIGFNLPDYTGNKASMIELKSKYIELMNVINSAAEELEFDGMTDLDKLLLAHDYIIDNCAYYKTVKDGYYYYGDGYSYNSYGILVNKEGVCQGYSYAYPALLKAMGYPVENIKQVSSDELNHMWNFVRLDNKWYHMDLTWDDPIVANANGIYDMKDSSYQKTYHEFFLISNNTNALQRDESFSMEILGDNIFPSVAQDSSYENGYIFNIRNRDLPGNIKYSDGKYCMYTGKLYSNRRNGLYYIFDTIKAPDYAISQPCKILQTEEGEYLFGTLNSIEHISGNILFYIFSGSNTSLPEDEVCFYICFYNKNGEFIKTDKVMKNLNFGSNVVYSYEYTVPENAYMFKLICVDSENIRPIINTPVIIN